MVEEGLNNLNTPRALRNTLLDKSPESLFFSRSDEIINEVKPGGVAFRFDSINNNFRESCVYARARCAIV